ncbi:MAG: hypothetical protein AB7I04_05980 [Pseudomonadales bacterium]
MKIAFVLLTGLALAGCGSPPVLSGRYHYGGEVDIVCPCGSSLCYWVRAEPAIAKALHDFALRHAEAPYQGMYLRWRGQLLDEPRIGFPANYDGLMRVEEVLTLTAEIPGDCAAP